MTDRSASLYLYKAGETYSDSWTAPGPTMLYALQLQFSRPSKLRVGTALAYGIPILIRDTYAWWSKAVPMLLCRFPHAKRGAPLTAEPLPRGGVHEETCGMGGNSSAPP